MARADAAESSTKKRGGRISAVRARVRALPGGWVAWRIGVTIVGAAVIVVGIILLPLPGPGWLIIFAGLGILSTEYVWAQRLLRFARDQLRRWTDWAKGQPWWMQALVGLAGLVFLAAVFYLVWLVLYR
jgi:uncharacterized protein (TIGR02611 family)